MRAAWAGGARRCRRLLGCLAAALLAACAAPAGTPVPSPGVASPAPARWKAVLVAGDGTLPVFDNAVRRLQARLRDGAGVPAADVQRLGAIPAPFAQEAVRPASLDRVLGAIGGMRPAAGQGCLVYATSHGVADRGLALAPTGEVLTPDALDRALVAGCGDAPTVAVISGCYTGDFARAPMARPNRVVLTAARADRPSFGCGAGYEYTVFDRCLLDAMERGGDWERAYAVARACVSQEERKGGFLPSEPQAHFGPAVRGLPVPAGAG